MQLIKYIYHRTKFGRLLSYLYHNFKNRVLPESLNIKNRYRKTFKQYPDLKNPKTLNEKILWLKLNSRTELHTQCADKFAVREYIAKTIGEKYLVPLIYNTRTPSDITPEKIPDFPCVIKTNHDSGGVFFIYNKLEVDWYKLRKELKSRLKTNYYWRTKEWQYKNIIPRVIIEKLLLDQSGNIPLDYKLHCFNGKVNMIQVDIGRGTDDHYRNWYSPQWKREPYRWSSPKGSKFTDPSDEDIPKPKSLREMIKLSEVLAQPFLYVRVDWYVVNEILFFGELTFHHDGGNQPILPSIWDKKLGDKLKLPIN